MFPANAGTEKPDVLFLLYQPNKTFSTITEQSKPVIPKVFDNAPFWAWRTYKGAVSDPAFQTVAAVSH